MTSWEDKKNDGQDGPHARNVCWRQGGVLGQGDKNKDGQENRRIYKQGNKRLRGQDTKCNIATKTGPVQGRTNTTGQEQRWTREHPNWAPCKGRVKWQEDKNNDEQQHVQRTKHRTRGQYYKLTRRQDNKKTTRGQGNNMPWGQEQKWKARWLHPKRAPCKGRVLMTRKQEDKRAIIFMKDKRTSPMQGTSTYDREEREDKRTTTN